MTKIDLIANCVDLLLKERNIKLVEITPMDIAEYLNEFDDITFDNIIDLVNEWIVNTADNFPEYLA